MLTSLLMNLDITAADTWRTIRPRLAERLMTTEEQLIKTRVALVDKQARMHTQLGPGHERDDFSFAGLDFDFNNHHTGLQFVVRV